MPHPTRTLRLADVPAAVPLLDAAYGPNPTFEARLRRYVGLQPDGWVAVDDAHGLVGIGGFVAFGDWAYVGLMAAAPRAQRRGIGGAIFEEILSRCAARGASLLLLDASAPGAPLYAKHGFTDHGASFAFAIDPRAVDAQGDDPDVRVEVVRTDDTSLVGDVAALDARAYGADRAALVRGLLAQLPGRAFVARDAAGGALLGYAIAQRRSFGPCAASSSRVARALLRRATTLDYDGAITWLVAGQNRAAMDLASSVSGAPTRTWRHMRRGSGAGPEWSSLFAKASLAVG